MFPRRLKKICVACYRLQNGHSVPMFLSGMVVLAARPTILHCSRCAIVALCPRKGNRAGALNGVRQYVYMKSPQEIAGLSRSTLQRRS